MTPVGDYLKKLLYQYDCLVVPELGAFLTHYLPASFSESTGQYLPPRKRLAFNEALRLDDGILINYIMLHESKTRDEALRFIGSFVTSIRQQMRTSGSFTLEGIGLLTVNEEGKFQFHPELRHNFFAESFGLPSIQAQYLESTAVSLPVSIVPLPVNQSLVVASSVGEAGKLMPMPVRRPAWYWAAATLIIGSLAALSYFSVQSGQLLQSSLSPASLLRFPALVTSVLPTTDQVPARAKQVVRADDATPVVDVKPVLAEAPVPVPIRETPVVVASATPTPVLVAKKAVVIPQRRVAVAVAKPVLLDPIMVVAGSFSSRANALRLKRQLQKAGFGRAFLILPTRRRELIKVAAYGASTLADADTALVKVSEVTGVPAWLMRTR